MLLKFFVFLSCKGTGISWARQYLNAMIWHVCHNPHLWVSLTANNAKNDVFLFSVPLIYTTFASDSANKSTL